jgi:hypothetical protein
MTEPTEFRGRGLAQPEQYSKDVRRASHQAPVGRVDGGRANLNQNFVVLRNGLLHVHDLDNVRGAVSGIGGGFHWRSPATVTWSLDRMCDQPSAVCD